MTTITKADGEQPTLDWLEDLGWRTSAKTRRRYEVESEMDSEKVTVPCAHARNSHLLGLTELFMEYRGRGQWGERRKKSLTQK